MSSSQERESSSIYSMLVDQDKRVNFYHTHLQTGNVFMSRKKSFIQTKCLKKNPQILTVRVN